MGTNWTNSQLEVLNSTNQDLLVSAAAGSGKTAVMVEKILKMITEGERPVDIDTILAVTFTKAAASEMKERLYSSLSEMAKENPDDEHIYKQLSFINNAKITTIDSFCSWVVRQNYNLTDLDPLFRVADESEIALLKSDVFKELLDEIITEIHENDNKEFSGKICTVNLDELKNVMLYYTKAKSKGELEDTILTLYDKSRVYVDPDDFLKKCIKSYEYENYDDFQKSEFLQSVRVYLNKEFDVITDDLKRAEEILKQDEELDSAYGDIIRGYIYSVDGYKNMDFDSVKAAIYSIKIKDGKRCPKGGNKEFWDEAMQYRNKAAEGLKKIRETYFIGSLNDIYNEISECYCDAKTLVYLCETFADKFAKVKRDNNICDFNDISHKALDILVRKDENGNYAKTETAINIGKQFSFCLIDEYQDSNEVQEVLLASVSHANGKLNRFMVGDVKQSIYGFRNSDPGIFMDKYESYKDDKKADERRILLDSNFRSRREVVDSVNFIFKQIMIKNVGGIDYDDNHSLKYGANYPASYKEGLNNTELIVINDEESVGHQREVQCFVVADRIKDLLNPESGMKVYDKKKNEYRPVRKSDIAILSRDSTMDNNLIDVLSKFGIESYSEKSTGYFNAEEIRLLLNILSVIDNPKQDIPLVAVMSSKLYEFSDEELAIIRLESDKKYYYECVNDYAISGSDENIKQKIVLFIETINNFRKQSNYISIYDLIDVITKKTGLDLLVAAMPTGRVRKKNIEMLKEMALKYENSSYKGVFNFIRFIEKQRKFDYDNASAKDVSENDDAVRIMTIHKSKGLQFPIVILFNSSKEYNTRDSKNKVVIDKELGMGLEYHNNKTRIKNDSLNKKIIKKKLKSENRGEELRLLYVALTRAEEKLIIIGANEKEDTFNKHVKEVIHNPEVALPESIVDNNNSYLDNICCALGRHRYAAKIFSDIDVNILNPMHKESMNTEFDIYICDVDNKSDNMTTIYVDYYGSKEPYYAPLIEKNNEDTSDKFTLTMDDKKEDEKVKIKSLHDNIVFKDEVKTILKHNFSYKYPYEKLTLRKAKLSVSEAKRISAKVLEDEEEIYKKEDVIPILPNYLKEDKEDGRGADYGSAIHRFFEVFDYNIEFTGENKKDEELLKEMADDFFVKGLISNEIYKMFNTNVFLRFINSEIYEGMKEAYANHKLYREKQFIITMPADRIIKDGDKEPLLMQGIMDAYYMKDDRIILIDYKSDKVDSLEELKEKYKVQLDIYKYTLEKLYKKKVDAYIYSTRAGRSIKID